MSLLNLKFLPSAAVTATNFDQFFKFIVASSVVFFVAVVGAGLYFAWKGRRQGQIKDTPYIPHSYLVEFCSIFITSIWVAVIFIWGWGDYKSFITPKQDEYEINITGQQWSWQMQYANGKTLTNQLVVPRGRPIKLIMGSKDVLHSFFIPAFRVKNDLVPGQFTALRFTPTKTGEFDLFCAEYCGTSHSGMVGKVDVLEPEDFQKWLDGTFKIAKHVVGSVGGEAAAAAAPISLAEQGAVLYKTKTCNTCHTINGGSLIGPSFKGIWGKQEELMDGTRVTVDENYVRESLMDPMKKIVKGFSPSMPTFRGMLSDEEVNALIAYLKTLK